MSRRREQGRMHPAVLIGSILLGPLVMVSKCVFRPDGDNFERVKARATASVCLITVDGIAPADLPLYNQALPADPFLTEFARLGVTVINAYGANNTSPAAAVAVMTGELPSTHGVLNYQNSLNKELLTLGEMFDLRGMRTAAFSNVPILTQCGMGQGIHTQTESIGAGAGGVGQTAADWLATLGEEYFFCWIHYFIRPEDEADRAAAFTTLLKSVTDGLQRGRKTEGTFVIATGTYGRHRGDLSVPMLWKIPKRTAIGARRNGPCSTLDILPTLVSIFGLRTTLKLPGRNLVADPDQPLYTGHYFTDPVGALFETFVARSREPTLGIRNHRWGVTQGPAPGNVAAYKIEADPDMTTNLVGTEEGDRAKSYMLEKLFERKAAFPHQSLPPDRLLVDEPLRSQLQKMGLFD